MAGFMHGWIILDKPLGLGSTQGVSAVKRALRTDGNPKMKVGHGGTLDPLATGVLPIAIGEATKLAGRMLDSDKIYDFTIAFGTQTDGLDAEGAVVATSDHRPTLSDVLAILPRFTGPIDQVPPAFSAIKIDGKRAYDLARAGKVVEIAARAVEIFALNTVPPSQTFPLKRGGLDSITLSAHVSKGTYIRSLARDIALALGTVGHVTMLRRTKAGPFTLEQSISLDKLADAAMRSTLKDIILPIRTALDDIPALALDPDQARLLMQGRVLSGVAAPDGQSFAMLGEILIALVDCQSGDIRVERGFNL